MHYRCVLYMLNCCVLLGLDWAEPMMLFTLHIICSCIFMHTYQFCIYHLILKCLVLFSVCVCLCVCVCVCMSLSLSLLLALVCSMAPKHKSTPSQNLLCSGASSFDPTSSHVRFRDEKAKSNFSENFARHGIHSKRQVVLLNFFDTNLPTINYNRGWESLCGISITCHSVII